MVYYWTKEAGEVISELESLVGKEVSNVKIAVLQPNEEVGWHIDESTRERFIVLVSGEHEVQVNRHGKIHSLIPKVGELWFLNISWEHRVINLSDTEPRIALICCFGYEK